MCHCQNSLLVAFPSKFIVSAVEFSVCRNKSVPFYFYLVLRVSSGGVKELSSVSLCTHCFYLNWTSVWTVWGLVCFVGLELGARISAFSLSSFCLYLLFFSFHLALLNCTGCDSLHCLWKWSTVWASFTGLQSEIYFFFFL